MTNPDAVRARYATERAKRLRSDGIGQYVGARGEYARFAADPWVGQDVERAARDVTVDVVVVGAGFSGLMTAVELQRAGVTDLLVVDKAGDAGGTWYWNRYPGVHCDTEAYIYLPLLEETGYVPSQKYVPGAEIMEHARRIVAHFELEDRTLLRTAVTSATWGEGDHRWWISTDRGDRLGARFLIVAAGIFDAAKLPGVPGIDSFGGHVLHTSRWDCPLDQLAGMRVGVVGTGATAVQLVPELARAGAFVTVFQRTPAMVAERNNRATDLDWFAALPPGWWEDRNRNFLEVQHGTAATDLVADGWTELFKVRAALLGESGQTASVAGPDDADLAYGERLRRRVDEAIADPVVADRLKAWYGQWCKRPLFHDEYLAAFNRPNVTLVDTDGKGIERVTTRGVVSGGTEYELDHLVFASGFEVGTPFTRRAAIELHGRDGRLLSEHWNPTVTTFQRCATHGFPNCFFVGLMEAIGPAPNFVYAAHQIARHVGWVVGAVLERGATSVEVTEEAEAAFQRLLGNAPSAYLAYQASCTPGYFNAEGRGLRLGASYFPGGQLAYFDAVERWRRDGNLAGLRVR